MIHGDGNYYYYITSSIVLSIYLVTAVSIILFFKLIPSRYIDPTIYIR